MLRKPQAGMVYGPDGVRGSAQCCKHTSECGQRLPVASSGANDDVLGGARLRTDDSGMVGTPRGPHGSRGLETALLP